MLRCDNCSCWCVDRAECNPCGNGVCDNGEDCNTCPVDCGSCEFCGDGNCNNGETCADCPADCGGCSCTLSLADPELDLPVTGQGTLTAFVTPGNGPVGQVNFSSANAGVASVDPGSDASPVYSTTVTANSAGSTTVTAEGIIYGSAYCSDASTVNVIYPAWWQVEGGNIHADGGNVSSQIPATATLPYLITGGEAGLVSYSGSLDLDGGTINQNGSNWQAQTSYQGLRTGYGYFKRILEDDPLTTIFLL